MWREVARQVDVAHQQVELLGGACQQVERAAQGVLPLCRGCQPHAGLRFRAEALRQFLAHLHRPGFHQLLQGGQAVGHAGLPVQLVHRVLRTVSQQVEQALLAGGERGGVAFEVGIGPHAGLAARLHARRHGSLVHVARRGHVVGSHPLPQLPLQRTQDGCIVEQGQHLLGFMAFGPGGMYPADEGGVHLPLAKRHDHAHTRLHRPRPFGRHGVGEHPVQRQGHDDIHVCAKRIHNPQPPEGGLHSCSDPQPPEGGLAFPVLTPNPLKETCFTCPRFRP